MLSEILYLFFLSLIELRKTKQFNENLDENQYYFDVIPCKTH